MSPLKTASLLAFAVAIGAPDVTPAAEVSKATQALQEADEICRADNGALWGISLCGPLLLVDPATRLVVANQADLENQLKPNGDAFESTSQTRLPIGPEQSGR